jgi:hypothetical protein
MRLSRFLLFGLLALVPGCNDDAGPGDLAISVVPGTSNIHAGETLGITVTVINIGSVKHTITGNTCPRPLEVFDSEGNEIEVRGELCSQSLLKVTLAPGESYTLQFSWDGKSSAGTDVATGSYMLRSHVESEDLGILRGGMATVYVLP